MPEGHHVRHIAPFNRLSQVEFDRVLAATDLLYLARDAIILTADAPSPGLYCIIKGMVQETHEDGLVTYYGPEQCFPKSLLGIPNFTAITVVEEVICHFLPRRVFLDLANTNTDFLIYYSRGLTSKIAHWLEEESAESLSSMMTTRVAECELPVQPMIRADLTIRETAILMKERRIDALLVQRNDHFGIVTSADIRDGLAIRQLPVTAAIGQITTWRLVTVAPDELLFNALLCMTRNGLRRLVISSGENRAEGILSLADLLSHLGNHAFLIIQRIDQAVSLADLTDIAGHQTHLVRSLFAKGVKMRHIGRLTRELDRRILHKTATLLAPPDLLTHLCLVVMGSEGRGEQILRTDQDNAMIVEAGYPLARIHEFRQEFTLAMAQLGYPDCPGKVMMGNPQWCGTVLDYQQRIRTWIDRAEPTDLLHLATIYDMRAVAGQTALRDQVFGYLLSQLPDDQAFFAHFAKPIRNFATPLGIFSRFLMADDAHQEELDIKKGGIFPIIHGIRSLALEHRLEETGTTRRVAELAKLGALSSELGEELIAAFDFMTMVRIRGRLEQMAQGRPANNYIRPEALNRLEREMLRDSFKIVNHFKKLISHHYHLDQLP